MIYYIEKKNYSWMDPYKILDAEGNTKYEIDTVLTAAVGHEHIVYDDRHWEVGRIKERITTMKPVYEIAGGGRVLGKIRVDYTFLKKKRLFEVNYRKWKLTGDIEQLSYEVFDQEHRLISYSSEEREDGSFFRIEFSEDVPEPDIILLICGVHLTRASLGIDELA